MLTRVFFLLSLYESLLHTIDKAKKIQELCGQKYVGVEGDLFIFIVDLYRNQQIRTQLNKDDVRIAYD